MSSIFTKIIAGDLPSYKIHEDDLTIAILALDQVNPGHVIVIPKQEINHWFDVPAEAYTRVGLNAQKIAKAIQKVTGCPRVGTLVAGFEVPHYHLHLIPAWSIPDLDFKRAKRLPENEMLSLKEKIIQALD
ncbi:MAG: HIT family protein [Bdellovibrio sp.]|nr:HIT family protein [Bdellovibrio sp.]